MTPKRFFISYTQPDREWAEWIAWVAEQGGHRVELQVWDFGPGSDFIEKMHAASATSDATIAVLSPDYLTSQFAAAEWRVAVARDPSGAERRLIPVRVRECEPQGLLQTRVYLDLVGRGHEAARRLLWATLRGDRAKPEQPPPFPALQNDRAFPGREDDLEAYRSWALDRHGHLELVGLGAGDFRFDLDEVYVPLGIAPRRWRPDDLLPRRIDEIDHGDGDEVALDDVFRLADTRGTELTVFGEAGAGKTTVLRKLLHQVLTSGAISLGLPAPTLPVFLRLRRLERAHLAGSLADFIQRELDAYAPGRFPAPFAQKLWERGDLLLLLDGLDEIADDALRGDVCRHLDERLAGERDRGIRAVVSSRFSGHGGELGGRFLPLDVLKLDDARVGLLVRSWFRAARRAMEPRPERWPTADDLAATDATTLLETLRGPDYASRQILTLVSSPLLLTLLCIVVLRGGEVPKRRTEFYRECLRVLLGRWSKVRGTRPPLDVDDALDVLSRVALRMHEQGRRDDLTPTEFATLVSAQVDRLGRRQGRELTASDLLRWLHRDAGVLAEYGPDRYGFSHLGLQEFLAATQIAKAGEARVKRLADEFGDDWWREVTLLLLALPGYRVFAPYMAAVAAHGPVEKHLDVLRQCLDDAHEPDPAAFVEVIGDAGTETRRRTELLRVFIGRGEPEVAAAALPFATHEDRDLRAVAQRLAQEAGLELPPQVRPVGIGEVWVEPTTGMRFLPVPGGVFEMGARDLGDACGPPHQVEVSPFWLAETPVTNRQYARFLEKTGHAEPAYWRDGRFSSPDQPVVGVSWHDATEFCTWLGKESGREIGLPSEAQWERASRGDDGRAYPWGDEPPNSARAVFEQDRKTGKPAPVGSVPEGRGPYGHLDLAGNVWEWCADCFDGKTYEKRAASVARDPVAASGVGRVLRGGSWNSSRDYARAAYRSYDAPQLRFSYFGFRLLCSSPISVDL